MLHCQNAVTVHSTPSDFSHTVSGYVPTVPGTVGDWENCMAQSYVPVRNSDPLMQSETSDQELTGYESLWKDCGGQGRTSQTEPMKYYDLLV